MIKKVLLAFSLFFLPLYINQASANQIDTEGLTTEQIQEINSKINNYKMQNDPLTRVEKQAEDVSKYVELGRSIGVGLGEAAKSLGVEVNKFASTPVGKMATFLIVYHIVGDDILGFIVGFFWYFTLIPLWCYIHFRSTNKIANNEYISHDDIDHVIGWNYAFLIFILIVGLIIIL